jgi:hypothetical protein
LKGFKSLVCRIAVFAHVTRRKYVHVGSGAASLPRTVT